MTNDELKWMAGIIDSEGSFYMSYVMRKSTRIRQCWFHLKTSDHIIVPYCAKLLNRSYNSGPRFHEFKFSGTTLKKFILLIKDHLFIKKKQAEICLSALRIKNGNNTAYTVDEDNKWHNLFNEIKNLNTRGKLATNYGSSVDFEFSYQWFAGLIDGDGSIATAKFNSNNKKPFLKITLTDHHCIDFLSNYFNKTTRNKDKVSGNRRHTKTIRFMSRECSLILPKIIPYLKLKKDVATIALDVIVSRAANGNTNTTDHSILRKIDQIAYFNKVENKHKISYNNKMVCYININNPIVPDFGDGIYLYSDEIGDKYDKIISNRENTLYRKPVRPSRCNLRLVRSRDVKSFLDKFHYQGSTQASYNIGVFYNNSLVACMCIRRPTRQNSGDWEIVRMVGDNDHIVHGIWSYILKWIKKNNLISGNLISFSDNRLMTGNVYYKMGFSYISDVRKDYYWVKNGIRYHKSGLRKPSGCLMTESELRESEGYHKIYDMGKKKWSILI